MTNIVVVMDMNIGFAKRGSLFSPRTEKLIHPISDFCREKSEAGWKILALTDTHDPADIEFGAFPPHCISDSGESEVVPEIKQYCDIVLPKYTTGGFFEVQEAAKDDSRLDLTGYDEIHIVGCCTDLCVYNFSIITQKYLELQYHHKRISRMPRIVAHKSMIDTYDTERHPAEEINHTFFGHIELNGIEVIE